MRDLETLVESFERQWSSDPPPSLEAFLGELKLLDLAAQQRSLVELICIDIEYRWKTRRAEIVRQTIEDYLTVLHTVSADGKVPLVLIEEEYRARQQWGDRPSHRSFVERFPGRDYEIDVTLRGIDDELMCERSSIVESALPSECHGSMEIESSELPRIQFSDLILHQMIGVGQTGKVYRTFDKVRSEFVAVKFLHKAFWRDTHAATRFLREALIVHRLRHDGVVRVDGVGDLPNGGYFIVMECLPGPDLSSILADGPVQIYDATRWTIQAARSIDFCHQVGIVHCDLKPGNLVLDCHSHVKVTDFGLARSASEASACLDRIAGTAPFMAPEQVSGWWGEIGPHTDVYELGAVLYTLLTGRPPFSGTRIPDVLASVISGRNPVPPKTFRPEASSALNEVVMKALSKHHGQRYRSALELAIALESVAPTNALN